MQRGKVTYASVMDVNYIHMCVCIYIYNMSEYTHAVITYSCFNAALSIYTIIYSACYCLQKGRRITAILLLLLLFIHLFVCLFVFSFNTDDFYIRNYLFIIRPVLRCVCCYCSTHFFHLFVLSILQLSYFEVFVFRMVTTRHLYMSQFGK